MTWISTITTAFREWMQYEQIDAIGSAVLRGSDQVAITGIRDLLDPNTRVGRKVRISSPAAEAGTIFTIASFDDADTFTVTPEFSTAPVEYADEPATLTIGTAVDAELVSWFWFETEEEMLPTGANARDSRPYFWAHVGSFNPSQYSNKHIAIPYPFNIRLETNGRKRATMEDLWSLVFDRIIRGRQESLGLSDVGAWRGGMYVQSANMIGLVEDAESVEAAIRAAQTNFFYRSDTNVVLHLHRKPQALA